MIRIGLLTLLLCFTLGAFAQEERKILLLNGHLHIGNGNVLEAAFIGTKGGKISVIRNSLVQSYYPEDWDTIIDLNGQHVYPAFVAPNSTLGLTEIDAVRATRDYDEVGKYNPHIRAQIAYNVESNVVSTVRTNGVLITQATPRGGDISGTSSVMLLDGWNWEDATIRNNDGIHVNWPSSIDNSEWENGVNKKKVDGKYELEKEELVSFFQMALAYAESNDHPIPDVRLEAMIDCFKGKKRVYFHADELRQLNDIIEFSSQFKLKFPVIVGGYDSYKIAYKLKDAEIPVMLGRLHSLPLNDEDPIDLPYRLPSLLKAGGVEFCLQNAGDMEAMNTRNLPFQAGTAMAYGLSEEEAVRCISQTPAKIMGIDQEYGTIEEGKSATLFVSKGNALDMRTNQVTLIMVNGELMETDNFQMELYRKYKNKYDKQASE